MSNVVNEVSSEQTTIKNLREELDLNIAEVANDLGITRQTLYCWENDLSSCTVRHLRVLCEYFGCSPDDLVY